MLNRLRLQNFKAWRRADLTFGRVTGFFGSNSAGKSSLLHFLLLLKQTRNATDRGIVLDFGGPADLVSLGTFADAIHQRDTSKTIDWILDWTLPEVLEIANPQAPWVPPTAFSDSHLQIRCEVGFRDERLWPRELAYRFDGVSFRQRSKRNKAREFLADQYELVPKKYFRRNLGRVRPLPQPLKSYLFPSQARSYYQNTDSLGEFELAYENMMDSTYYLGPLRESPRREYHWAGSRPDDVGQRGEWAMNAILAATIRGEKRSLGHGTRRRPFQGVIAYWLHKLGLIRDFHLEEIAPGTNLYRAMVRTSSIEMTSLTDIGFGVSQILPVLVLLYHVPRGSTVLLEQPEIHLHPAIQSGLADVMLNVSSARDVQIVVESHSEHLMRRLQRRVAEQRAFSQDVKLYFVSSSRGSARASDLQLNQWGEIENWPENFFGDEMGEIAAITEAALRRRMEHSE